MIKDTINGETTNFPRYMEAGLKFCPHGHPRYPTSPEAHPEKHKCGRCRVAGYVDHEGRQTQKGKYHKEQMKKEAG